MKKLKLTAFQLGNSEILTRQQLRNVLGGQAGSSTTTTTTTKLVSQLDCGMSQCLVGDVLYACVNDPILPGKCKCNADGLGCSTGS